MTKPTILAALLLAATPAAFAATPPAATKAQPAAPRTPPKIPGVSDEGNAIISKAQAVPDPQLQELGKQIRAAHDQLMSAVMAPVIDIDKVAAAMNSENDLQAQIRARGNERLVAVLQQLSNEDRGTFLRTLVLAHQQRRAAATPKP
jgi:uncharacterized membrane protein